MIDTRTLAGGFDPHGNIWTQDLRPRHLPGARVEFRQVDGAELIDAREDAARPSEFEVRAPDVGPAAVQFDTAGNGLGLEAVGACFGAQRSFQARNRDEEYLKAARREL